MRKETEREWVSSGWDHHLSRGFQGAGTRKGAKAADYYVLSNSCVIKSSPCTLASICNTSWKFQRSLSTCGVVAQNGQGTHRRSKKRSKRLAGSHIHPQVCPSGKADPRRLCWVCFFFLITYLTQYSTNYFVVCERKYPQFSVFCLLLLLLTCTPVLQTHSEIINNDLLLWFSKLKKNSPFLLVSSEFTLRLGSG